jgi:hypothetical protein
VMLMCLIRRLAVHSNDLEDDWVLNIIFIPNH